MFCQWHRSTSFPGYRSVTSPLILMHAIAAGTIQRVYTVRDVRKGDQLCVHYTNLYEPRKVRQLALLQEKFFMCACDRCSTPIERSIDRFLEVSETCLDFLHLT